MILSSAAKTIIFIGVGAVVLALGLEAPSSICYFPDILTMPMRVNRPIIVTGKQCFIEGEVKGYLSTRS